jgi:hypothetical protein
MLGVVYNMHYYRDIESDLERHYYGEAGKGLNRHYYRHAGIIFIQALLQARWGVKLALLQSVWMGCVTSLLQASWEFSK